MINKILFWTWLISLILTIVFIVLVALDDGTNRKTYLALTIVFGLIMLILLFVIAIRMDVIKDHPSLLLGIRKDEGKRMTLP